MIISAGAVLLVPASTSILSLYTHPRPLHLSSEPIHPSSVSTSSFSLHSHPQPLHLDSASTPILSFYIHPQPLNCPKPLHQASKNCSFSLSINLFMTNVMSSLSQFSCILYIRSLARISHVKIALRSLPFSF